MMDSKRVLLTGGAGFIGSNIASHLLKNGVKYLRILDNLSTGRIENIKELLNCYDNVEFIKGDTTNLETCEKCMVNIDIVCHQAALGSVPRSINNPLATHNNNVNGFFNILLSAKNAGVKRVVYASSSSVYGDNDNLPKIESIKGNPISPYAASKSIGDIYASVFHRCYGLETIGLIYFNVFVPRQDPKGAYAAVIPKFIDSLLNKKRPIIYGDGSFSRDFTYIDNVVCANINAMLVNNNKCYGQTYNIGAGRKTTILDIFNLLSRQIDGLQDLLPIFEDKRDGDVPHSVACIDKAKSELGYEIKKKLEDGLKETIEFYNSLITLK